MKKAEWIRQDMENFYYDLKNWLDQALDNDHISDEMYDFVQNMVRETKTELHDLSVDILAGKYDHEEDQEDNTFSIYEGFVPALEKKIKTIQNKCKKYGCSFIYEKVGEEFKEVPTGERDPFTNKMIYVSCRGTFPCGIGKESAR